MRVGKVIEPNEFRMRTGDDFPWWKAMVWRVLGKKDFGISQGYYCEGYWLFGICYVTKCFEVENEN